MLGDIAVANGTYVLHHKPARPRWTKRASSPTSSSAPAEAGCASTPSAPSSARTPTPRPGSSPTPKCLPLPAVHQGRQGQPVALKSRHDHRSRIVSRSGDRGSLLLIMQTSGIERIVILKSRYFMNSREKPRSNPDAFEKWPSAKKLGHIHKAGISRVFIPTNLQFME